jgi:DNA-binding response OmpR family regulator
MSDAVTRQDAALARNLSVASEAARKTETPARLLLADDEPEVSMLMYRILSREGWQVVRVCDGAQAVSAWPEGGQPFDLVILDLYMPHKGGYQAYQELRRLHPKACFLFVTGCLDDDPTGQRVIDEGLPYLLKPFNPQDLILAVKALLRKQG